jgi:hypothetical protein
MTLADIGGQDHRRFAPGTGRVARALRRTDIRLLATRPVPGAMRRRC